MRLITVPCIFLCLVGEALGARILGLFPLPGRSHLMVTSSVMHALAKKGHDVTMFVPFSTSFNAPNYKEIIYENVPLKEMEILEILNMSSFAKQFGLYFMGLATTEAALDTPEAKALMASEEEFDIIVMEQFVNEAFFAYVYKFKCPVVLISTLGITSEVNRIFGNSAPYSYVPSGWSSLSDRMNFTERLFNTVAGVCADLIRKYFYMPKQQALAEKYLAGSGITIPPLEEIESQANFVLLNSHHAFSTPRPYMANMKEIAGIHLKPSRPLPPDLQEYLNSSKNGVILFSLGSGVQSIQIPDFISSRLKGAFKRLPYDVLWKWENDTMANKPKNVRIRKWLPQNDILGHPNLKLFITHGGVASIIETVHHAVPIVGIPLYGDQPFNVWTARSKGYAELLDFISMTEDEIYDTVMKVASDPKYRENVKKVSEYWKDELSHPLDVAVHSVEYVLKHGGAMHLRAAVTEQNFVQYLLLDIGLTIILTFALIYYVIRMILRTLCKKTVHKKDFKKTN